MVRLQRYGRGRQSSLIEHACDFLNENSAYAVEPSANVSVRRRQVLFQPFSVFQLYWKRCALASNTRWLLPPALVVSSMVSIGAVVEQLTGVEVIDLTFEVSDTTAPEALVTRNLTGTVAPPLVLFNVGALSTGEKNPANVSASLPPSTNG